MTDQEFWKWAYQVNLSIAQFSSVDVQREQWSFKEGKPQIMTYCDAIRDLLDGRDLASFIEECRIRDFVPREAINAMSIFLKVLKQFSKMDSYYIDTTGRYDIARIVGSAGWAAVVESAQVAHFELSNLLMSTRDRASPL